MKKSAYLVNIAVAVAVMRFAGGAYAADFGDLAVNASDLKASAESQDVRRPGDGHGGPGEHHDGPGPNHVCPPAPFAPSDRDYNIEGTEADCRVLNISAQSPNTYTIKLQAKQVGTYTSYLVVARTDFWGCINGYERTEAGSGPYETTYGHGREITVEVGPRVLAAGETEQLNVCLTPEYKTTVDTGRMLYEYKVAEENTSNFFKKASKFTLIVGLQALLLIVAVLDRRVPAVTARRVSELAQRGTPTEVPTSRLRSCSERPR